MKAVTITDVNIKKQPQKTLFTTLEARVITSFIEKHLTTLNNYPLIMNSLANAYNQKSNREPVMSLTEGQIGHTINILVERKCNHLSSGLLQTVVSSNHKLIT